MTRPGQFNNNTQDESMTHYFFLHKDDKVLVLHGRYHAPGGYMGRVLMGMGLGTDLVTQVKPIPAYMRWVCLIWTWPKVMQHIPPMPAAITNYTVYISH